MSTLHATSPPAPQPTHAHPIHLAHGRLARRHRHDAPGTLKCQNIHHNQRQQSVSHRGPAQAHGYRIRECSSVLGPYPDYAHSTAAVTMCGLIRIDVKPGARRGSSKDCAVCPMRKVARPACMAWMACRRLGTLGLVEGLFLRRRRLIIVVDPTKRYTHRTLRARGD